jgi:hypothetical protein
MASFNIFINYETFHILYIDKHDQALSLIYIYIYRERENYYKNINTNFIRIQKLPTIKAITKIHLENDQVVRVWD